MTITITKMGCILSDRYYIGIDLGTVNTCLAYVDESADVKISRNDDGNGLLPSAILFTENGKYIGSKALEKSTGYNSSNSVFFFKRMMGTNYKRTYDGVTYNLSEMSAMILTKVIKNFTNNTGVIVDSAVVTVPGDFDDTEKNATIMAAKIAGIKNIELLNESVAASIAYRHFNKNTEDKKIIVYNLGGGTLDVTIMSITGSSFSMMSNESDKNIGGKDWDLQLANIIQKKVLDASGKTIDNIVSNSKFRMTLITEAEKQKIILETNERSVGTIILDNEPIKYIVTRTEFENATFWLTIRTINMVGYALRNAGLTMKDIDCIVLVGGPTKMPQIQRSLKEAYPSVDIISFDPQHAVARGASLYARSIFFKKDIKVIPIATKTIGILAGIDGVEKICNAIFRNTPLPIDKTLICRPKRDGHKSLDILIYESLVRNREDFTDVSNGKLLAKNVYNMSGKITRGKTKIPIRFMAAEDGRVSITVECNSIRNEYQIYDTVTTNDTIDESKTKLEDVL